jgi:dihydroorotase
MMSTKILIKNGRLIDPANKRDENADLLLADGKVAAVGKITDKADIVIDAVGKLVVPGLIDIHVHFREPGDEEEETIASGSAAAVAGGFTSVVCMPNTEPPVQDETSVEFVHRKARQARKTYVYTMGAITKDRKGVELAEMGLMKRAGAVGFTDDGAGVQDASTMLKALRYAGMLGVVVSQHCQDSSLAKNGVMNSGYNSTVLGLPGLDALAEEMMLWRDIQLVKKTKTRYHAQHVSTAGAIELIRQAKAEGLPVSCEVTPHHLLLTDDRCKDYDTNYKVNPPLRTSKDIEALRRAIKEGVVDALATDHAPHLLSEKELEFLTAPFGLASLECALGLYVEGLIKPGVISWPELIRMMTIGPANAIMIEKGSLAVGAIADVTVIDPVARYKVDLKSWQSKARNCPYKEWELTGRADYTIVGGEIRFKREG